jgi:hypothetical protein
MKSFCLLAWSVSFIVLLGCATPVEIKQALAAKDQAYAENIKLMEQYRDLLVSIHMRHQQWSSYVFSRLTIDLALQWATGNPTVKGVTDQELAKDDAGLLGPEIVQRINEVRLKGLPERKGPGPEDKVLFQAGHGKMEDLIAALPNLISLVEKKVMEGRVAQIDLAAYADYRANVGALRRINAMVKQYLDIDVTVKGEDLKQLADALKTLR